MRWLLKGNRRDLCNDASVPNLDHGAGYLQNMDMKKLYKTKHMCTCMCTHKHTNE